MTDKLSESLENLNQIITHIKIGLDEAYEKIKEINEHQEEQDKQLAKLFNLYREIEIDLSDTKRSLDKIKSVRILEELNEETKKLEGEEECEEKKVEK